VDKVRLLAAIAGTARRVASPRQWISEVNWPLREGPHSPAGKSVSVDEEAQADYLVRFFLLAGGAGRVERIDWWQLVAKGYGLCDPQPDGSLRERPSFAAMATLIRELAGATCHGPVEAAMLPAGGRAYRFSRAAVGSRPAQEVVVAWSTSGALDWTPRTAPQRIVDRDGRELALAAAPCRLLPAPRYFAFPAG
jgi:hypothetical protein